MVTVIGLTSDEESRCESEGGSDNGSVEEGDVSTSPLLHPSVSEDSEDYNMSLPRFSPQVMPMPPPSLRPMPSTILSDSGTVSSYLHLDCGPILFDKVVKSGHTATLSHSGCTIRGPAVRRLEALWNMNGVDEIEHEPGQANAEGEPHTLDWLDSQMRHIEPLVAREVEKRSKMGARLESSRLVTLSSTSPGQISSPQLRCLWRRIRTSWRCANGRKMYERTLGVEWTQRRWETRFMREDEWTSTLTKAREATGQT